MEECRVFTIRQSSNSIWFSILPNLKQKKKFFHFGFNLFEKSSVFKNFNFF